MNQLVPCPECQRHVRTLESICPFCSAELDLSNTPAHVLPSTRLRRLAVFTFGATLAVGVSAAGCGSDDSGGSGGTSSGGTSSGGTSSGGTGGSSTGGEAGADAGNSGGTGNVMPPYGIPPDE